jgi:hypothetical protein
VALSLEQRLLASIEFDTNGWGCWLYAGYINEDGYGSLSFGNVKVAAHRAAWRVWRGAIPADKPLICHHCDVGPCIRPDHLFAGTNSDNIIDASRKGRHPLAKLQITDIPVIRARLALGDTHRAVAADYGVSKSTIWQVRAGRSWRHVPAPQQKKENP